MPRDSKPSPLIFATSPSKVTRLLEESAALHKHLCPRQVLGVRMGLLAGELLGMAVPQPKKKKSLITIIETDGCFADGVAVATNCWVGRRTMFIKDYGKVAATFVDRRARRAFRITPSPDAREIAQPLAPEAANRWAGYLIGYQRMSLDQLFCVTPVRLTAPLEKIISKPTAKIVCTSCREEIFNEREVVLDGTAFCQSCADGAYYVAIG